ncbi:carbon catabolite repressor protein 4 homolog 5 isoform X1 [Pistacia vera]|uniref:carbon catabolite repressor protein 4 homolog 5 isoform X1 n=1 Tax=Pistacia vera TaxID=55513 RepID=UPI0012637BB1|nr:carbon catabolite repressor protein 4 homolog 5 isoform X1 [Pistacia vera]
MKSSNREEPPAAENSRATKRKHSLKSKQFDRGNKHAKRQRLTVSETLTISETETQTTFTLKPDPSRNPPTSNRFEPIRSSRKRNKTRKRRKSSATDECHRQWTFSSRDFSNFKDKFVVVSYNILGVENALKHPDLYMDVPPEFLEWERRKRLIREEIKRYNASILCFQEVDRFDDLDYLLRKDGFKGVYKARTGDARDGCAIFWKDKLFTLLHQENVEFQKFGLRHNVAQFCVLKMKQNLPEPEICEQTSVTTLSRSQSLVVGNTHVLFNPNRGDIKLGQVRLYLEKAYKLSQEWSKIPVLLAGDLNSSPQSAIYQFLASSKLDVQQHDRRYMSRQVEFSSNCRDFKFQNGCRNRGWMSISRPLIYGWSDEELRLATGSKQVTQLQHQLKLHSAYFGIPGSRKTRDNNGEPLATSYHSKFMGTVDYIWHTEELLPVRVLETLPIDILKGSAGLPCEFLQEIIFFQKLKCDLGKIEEVSSSEETG